MVLSISKFGQLLHVNLAQRTGGVLRSPSFVGLEGTDPSALTPSTLLQQLLSIPLPTSTSSSSSSSSTSAISSMNTDRFLRRLSASSSSSYAFVS